jgi:hypothetical protein
MTDTASSPAAEALKADRADPVVRDPPRARRAKLPFGWHAVSIVTGSFFGFSVLVLGHKYLAAVIFPPPIIQTNYEILASPDSNPVDAAIANVERANSEVLVSARVIGSSRLLAALKEKAQKISVKILLDPDNNGSPSEGAIGWLLRNDVHDVYLESAPNYNQFLVIDGSFVMLGATPFTAEGSTNRTSAAIFVTDTRLASKLRSYFFSRLGASHILQ